MRLRQRRWMVVDIRTLKGAPPYTHCGLYWTHRGARRRRAELNGSRAPHFFVVDRKRSIGI